MTKEEQFVNELIGYIFAYPDDDYMTMECLCRKLVKHGLLDKADGYYQTHDIRTNTHECVKDTHDKTEPRKEQNICGKCRYLYRDFKYGLSCYRLMDNEPCKYEERKDDPKTQTETQNSNLTFKTLEYCDICDHKGCEECIANALDEHCIPSQFNKQIEDECAKEYEELGLKELKELIEADRKTESSSEIPNNCEYAKNPSGDVWECGCFLDTYCEHQIYDRNPDGTINIVECGYEPKDEPQTERSER